jgi:site-specific DNA recombinase
MTNNERVSTLRQADEGYSLDGQLHELRERMESEGRRVVAEVADPGEKRWMYERPGLGRLKELAAGEIDEVWAWAWDRFGEHPWPTLLAIELGEYGVKIRSLDDGGEGDDAEMLRVLKGWIAKRDGGDRPRKSVMGKFSKARKGEILGAAFRPRYGFAYVRNGRGKAVGYAVDPEKMANVVRIFGMLADGAPIHAVGRWRTTA